MNDREIKGLLKEHLTAPTWFTYEPEPQSRMKVEDGRTVFEHTLVVLQVAPGPHHWRIASLLVKTDLSHRVIETAFVEADVRAPDLEPAWEAFENRRLAMAEDPTSWQATLRQEAAR